MSSDATLLGEDNRMQDTKNSGKTFWVAIKQWLYRWKKIVFSLGLISILVSSYVAELVSPSLAELVSPSPDELATTSSNIQAIINTLLNAIGAISIIFSITYQSVKSTFDLELKDILENKDVSESKKLASLFGDAIVKEKMSQIFEDARRTSSVFPVEEAMKFIWDCQEKGRIPLFGDLNYHILIEDVGDTLENDGDDSKLHRWPDGFSAEYLRIGYISHHTFDINRSARDDTLESPGILLPRLIRPIIVLPYEHYVKRADLWDRSRFTVIYPVTDEIIRCYEKSAKACPEAVGYFFRKFDWISHLSDSMIDNASYLDTSENGGKHNFQELEPCGNRKMLIREEGGSPNKDISVGFSSVYNKYGEFDSKMALHVRRELERELEKNGDDITYIMDCIKRWNRECSVVGMYIPDSKKRDDLRKRRDIDRTRIYSIWSYLVIRSIKNNCKSIHEQNFFNFPVGYCARLGRASVTLPKTFYKDGGSLCTLYSFLPYSLLPPSCWTDLGNAKSSDINIVTPDSNKYSEKLLYPSDVFSIRWSVNDEEAQTPEDEDTGTS